MNYCACSKALKKHDKTVGLDTRARFMRNVVQQQPFTHYPRCVHATLACLNDGVWVACLYPTFLWVQCGRES